MKGADAAENDPRFKSVPTLFFVIGAQKSGTTWLHYFLSQHPEVTVPVWKETNYWRKFEGVDKERNLERAFQKRFRRIRPVLRRLLRFDKPWVRALDRGTKLAYIAAHNAAPPHTAYADAVFQTATEGTRAAGEVCPQYAHLAPETYREMARLGADVKFLFLMRDPVARFISSAKHQLRQTSGQDAHTDNEIYAALERAVDQPRGWAKSTSQYRKVIETLESTVPASQIKYVFFEELFHQETVNDLCDFIGVSSRSAALDEEVNSDPQRSYQVPEELKQRVAQHLADVYDFTFDRFETLPEAWHLSRALIAAPAESAGKGEAARV